MLKLCHFVKIKKAKFDNLGGNNNCDLKLIEYNIKKFFPNNLSPWLSGSAHGFDYERASSNPTGDQMFLP
jgi:hypothetical protein